MAISVALLMSLFLTPTDASGNNRVGLVIDYGNGEVATRCVSFAEGSITGHEALQRAGLPIETDYQTGGAAVCRIDGHGCPASDCFCACRGGNDCKYWSYWHFANGVWGYSAIGAGIYELKDGAVDGWVWGLGPVNQASPPPAIPFGEICTDGVVGTPTVTPTASHTPTPIVMPTSLPPGGGFIATNTIVPVTTMQPNTTTPQATPTMTLATDDHTMPIGTLSVILPIATVERPIAQGTEPTDSPILAGGQSNDQPIAQAISSVLEIVQSPESQPIVTLNMVDATSQVAGDNASAIDAGLVASAVQPAEPVVASITATSVSMEVAGVIGEDVVISRPAFSRMVSEGDEQAATWSDYIGYAGLLLMIAALALFTHHRRNGSSV